MIFNDLHIMLKNRRKLNMILFSVYYGGYNLYTLFFPIFAAWKKHGQK